MPVETWLILTLCMVIVASVAALEIKDILSSIVSIGVVGLGVSICFLFLQAPDLAVVQFLFEIFALIILVKAFLGKDYHWEEPSTINNILTGVTVVLLAAIMFYSLPVFYLLPEFGAPLLTTAQYYLDNAASDTGAGNIVSAIILDYRAFDTLGEITILFTAILGTFTILKSGKSDSGTVVQSVRKEGDGMTIIVKTVTRISVWLILLYGIYIIMHGHLTPGGGFGGGVILALAFLNVMLAYGKNFTSKWLNIGFLHDAEAASAALFLILGLIGISLGGAFLANFLSKGELFSLISAGTILPLNIIIGVKVAMSLFLVVWALAGFKVEKGVSI
jgi:multicomponent Na+:H+ antiporter subunit B